MLRENKHNKKNPEKREEINKMILPFLNEMQNFKDNVNG